MCDVTPVRQPAEPQPYSYSYGVYGLSLLSEIELPELAAGKPDLDPDAVIRFRRLHCAPLPGEPSHGCFSASPDEAYFFWSDVGTILVREGREILIDAVAEAEPRSLRLIVLGMALGVLLHQRGQFTLHASAAVVNGGAVAFVGEKRQGKSTTAAALHGAGHTILADDIVLLEMRDVEKPLVVPGFPQLKLWPEAARELGVDAEDMPRLHPQGEKRGRSVADRFNDTPLPLRRIYVLTDGPDHGIETLSASRAFAELVKHSYALRFLGKAGLTSRHFHQCVQLSRSIPIMRLIRPRSLETLPDLIHLVATQAQRV